MIRFFHTADIHFGVENYGRIDPKTGIHSRLLDFKTSFDVCVNAAIEEQADFFLLCGDAYKTAYPTPTQQKLLIESLLKLHDAKIPVVIVVGNHDHPLSFGKAHALDIFSTVPLKTFHVFSKPEILVLETKNGPVQIVGIPWPTRNNLVTNEQHRFKDQHEITSYISEKIGVLIASFAQQLDPAIPSILCGHLTVTNGIFSGSEKCAIYGSDPMFLPSQLAIKPFDYVALGHLHRHQNLNPGGIPIVYAGSIERVDFGERKEKKGYCTVTIDTRNDETKETSYTFHIVPSRPMIQLDIHLKPEEDQTNTIVHVIEATNLDQAIVKVVYHLPEGRQDKVDLNAVLRACQKAHHVVGIFPVHKVVIRAARAQVSTHMTFDTVLKRFFDTRKELEDKKKLLLKKAQSLQAEVENTVSDPQ
ncbi:exonuclease SbcCD subunit D [Candidatus Dependentiae bacterium]|nr:exonuclease SbcCD subunit D [Candidatus Dependentiae bacterium]